MRLNRLLPCLAVLSLLSGTASAQPIIAQAAGLTNPAHVVTFGANLFANFTPVSTEFPGIVVSHARYFTTSTVHNLVGGFLTNNPNGTPNTLRIAFATPIRDLSFVYHQIGTSMPSVFRALLGGVVVDSFSNLSNQYQTNNYFGFTNVVFDELQLDFDADFNVDTLAFNDAQPSLTLNAPAVIGTTTTIDIQSTNDPGAPYLCALAFGTSPGIVLGDSRIIPLNYDLLLQYVLDPNQQILSNHIGSLSASSRATVNFFVPNAPVAIRATVYAAFLVANPSSFAGIGTISPALPITLQ